MVTRPELDNFFNNLQYRLQIFRINKKHTDLYLSSDFNVFDYIYPNENLLSDIIADLLDPSGSHGQGNVFLKIFLNKIGVDPEVFRIPIIRREDRTAYIQTLLRRIDITIEFANPVLSVGIENKPWAVEQKDQVKDYVDHLNKKCMGKFVLVYLSDNGKEPESIDSAIKEELKAEGKLKIVPYKPKLTLWLEKCIKECESEKVRWFLRDFVKYIDHNFKTILEDEEK